jgi:hypothetical protein
MKLLGHPEKRGGIEGCTEGAGGAYVTRLGGRRGQCPTLVRFMSFCQ